MSRRLYELLLITLPRGFREEFGHEMTQAFVDSRGALLANIAGVLGLAVRLRLDQLRVDLRHAVRGLMRQKTFTITAVTTLALALGPATAVFSLIDGVLFDPLPKARDLDRVLISAIGVYGVTAATTAARKRELAIRAAIGAGRGGLMRLVVRQGMVAALAGVILGIGGALAASSLLESVLYEVRARDPLTYGAVGLALLAVCGMATYLPARRALTISPAIALKEP